MPFTFFLQCIEINPQWAKGHIRLASSYIALGGHSNDACNSLQRALQLDPTNPTAREMLLKELRRESTGGTSASSATPTAPPEDLDDRNYNPSTSASSNVNQSVSSSASCRPTEEASASSSSPPSSSSQPTEESPDYQAQQQQNQQTQDQYNDIDDRRSWKDKIFFYSQRVKLWYMAQSDDVKSVLQVFIVLLLLYVAFGGRFGLASSQKKQLGNYGSGNVYDQYYGRASSQASSASYPYDDSTRNYGQQQQHQQVHRSTHTDENDRRHRQASSGSYGGTGAYQHRDRHYHQHDNHNQRSHYDDDYYYSSRQRQRQRGGGSTTSTFHLPNLFDGSIQSMLILGGIAYLCYRNGINPMQVIFFLNMMNRGGRHHHRRGMGMGYGGMGYGRGGMGGFGRRRW